MDDFNNFVKIFLAQPKHVPFQIMEILVRSPPVVDYDAMLVLEDLSKDKKLIR